LRDISEQHNIQLETSKKSLNNVLKRIARDQQQEIEHLLGRLRQKYKIGLTCPSLDLSYFPYNITLGDSNIDVELEEWGSGTKNRLHILLTIFRAKQVAESGASASKATPIIIIEEPESFLHPLAQAEFGSILQDLSEEFGVQIIVTTHSPYLLSQEKPQCNILLDRKIVRKKLRQTERTDTTGDKWMEPFSLSLGIDNNEFKPWKELFFNIHKSILLVEGDIDLKYFELLKRPEHGANALGFDGEIYAYGGRDKLTNQTLLKFIKDKFQKIFITFDLDSERIVKDTIEALGFVKNKSYIAIGVDAAGKRNIEGLIPDEIYSYVTSEYPDLTRALSSDNKDEQRNANQNLKKKLYDEFQKKSEFNEQYYGRFYKIVKIINKSLK
jgi:predicted ATP-dependent endonuclease of OLD family